MSDKAKRPLVTIEVNDVDTQEFLRVDAKTADTLWNWLISIWPQANNRMMANCTVRVWTE